jgi:uncharacterized protein YndB with AHSA1/START domain
MKRWEEKIQIKAPAEKVFAYVSDFARHGEWSGHGLQATKETDGPVAVGTKYATTAKQFGTQKEHSTIVEFAPPSKFAWDSTGALGRINHWFATTESGGETTLSKGAQIVEPKFLAKLMGFKIAMDQPKALRENLERIKARIEAS